MTEEAVFRSSSKEDEQAIHALIEAAFGSEEGPSVAKLALDMLHYDSKRPLYSFVIEKEQSLFGHILFSPVFLSNNEKLDAYILAPLAIARNHQGQGLGKQLISYGFDQLRTAGVNVVYVLGAPGFYSLSGFATEKIITTPYKTDYPEAWMSIELVPFGKDIEADIARCIEPLMAREYW